LYHCTASTHPCTFSDADVAAQCGMRRDMHVVAYDAFVVDT
jgi:hypothetical protein